MSEAKREAEALEQFERTRPETALRSRNESQRGETQLRHSSGEVEESFVDGYLAGAKAAEAEHSARESAQGEGWVACSEREAPDGVAVLLWSEHWDPEEMTPMSAVWDADSMWFLGSDGCRYKRPAKHWWRPLPPPPKAEGKP